MTADEAREALPSACTDIECDWQPVPHVHEGAAVYPAPPDDPSWVAALATDEAVPHD